MNHESFLILTVSLSVIAAILLVIVICLVCYYCLSTDNKQEPPYTKAASQKRVQQTENQRGAQRPSNGSIAGSKSKSNSKKQQQNMVTHSHSLTVTEYYGVDPKQFFKKNKGTKKKSHSKCNSCHKRKVSKRKLCSHEAKSIDLLTPVRKVKTTICPAPVSSKNSLSEEIYIDMGQQGVTDPTKAEEEKTIIVKRKPSLKNKQSSADPNNQANLTSDGDPNSQLSKHSSPTFTQGVSQDGSSPVLLNSSPTFPSSQNSQPEPSPQVPVLTPPEIVPVGQEKEAIIADAIDV